MTASVALTMTRKEAILVDQLLAGAYYRALNATDFRAYKRVTKRLRALLNDVSLSRVTRRYQESISR